jgi:hypothetical protein
VDSSDTYNIYPGDGDRSLYTEINMDLLPGLASYPGDLWPYRGLKIELPYLYLEHIRDSEIANGVVEVFLFDGAETPEAETLQPCTDNTLLNQLHGDSECSNEDAYPANRIFAAHWCGNNAAVFNCISESSDIWFDLQRSFNTAPLPYIENIPFDISTTLWGFGECPSAIDCWGWEGDDGNLNNVEVESLESLVNSTFTEQLNSYFSGWSESLKTDYDLTPADYFYIITRVGGTDSLNEWLGNSYQHFAIPKNIFRKLILNKQEEIFIGFGNNGSTGFNSGDVSAFNKLNIGEFDKTFPAPEIVHDVEETYSVNALVFKLTPPLDEAYDITIDDNAEHWIPEFNPWFDINSNAFNPIIDNIDYASLSLYSTEPYGDHLTFTKNYIDDFRPISNAFISIAGNDYSLQSYYDPYTFQYDITSAPLTLLLTFDISDRLYNIDYLNEDLWNGRVNSDHLGNYEIGYKFRVVQWGDEEPEYQYENDHDFIDNWDGFDPELYPFQDVRLGLDNPGTLQHTYLTNAVSEIKVFVFSYIQHPLQPNFVQTLKWKIVTIKIHLNDISENFHTRGLEDFGALGGADFITIPWPHPGATPVISGISDKSKYKKSLAMLSRGGLYESQGDPDYIFIKTANRNDELGDYLGKTDIEQVRVFNVGSYDMHLLLGIDPFDPSSGEWVPYTDDSYWTGNPATVDIPAGPTFHPNTSVGELYVDENDDDNLRDSCILELNLGDVENGTVRDTSGSGNKGMLLGDYSLEKIDINLPTMKDSVMNVPEIGEDDKAL